MLNTLYNIAGGIALAVGALGASDDFDGAQLAQNAFFGPEDEIEAIEEQETSNEVVLTVNDVLEWDEIASKAMEMSLTGSDELTDDEKLEITVLTGETPADVSENQAEVPQIEDNSQSEGLSEEEFYCILEQQFNDAISMLESEEVIADSEPLVIEAVQEDLAAVELQPEDDVNAEKALEEAQTIAESKLENAEEVATKEISEESFTEMEPWVVVHGLPDIPEEDMSALMDQSTKNEQPVKTEQIDIENVNVQEIPVVDSILVDIPEVEAPELDSIEEPLFDESDVEETEEVEAVEAEETEAETDDDALIVEPLEVEETEAESEDETLLIPSLEIPPAVLTEEQRAKINEEVDAIVDQSDNFDSWIPRQIPVSGSVEDDQPLTKPEDDFIQDFSRKNVKESILENNGIDLK